MKKQQQNGNTKEKVNQSRWPRREGNLASHSDWTDWVRHEIKELTIKTR